MKKLLCALFLISLSQGVVARVYMCVDPQTGTTSFTDKACERSVSGEEVRVDKANYSSGRQTNTRSTDPKVWNSDRDARKSGREYNTERRDLYENKASAGTALTVP